MLGHFLAPSFAEHTVQKWFQALDTGREGWVDTRVVFTALSTCCEGKLEVYLQTALDPLSLLRALLFGFLLFLLCSHTHIP